MNKTNIICDLDGTLADLTHRLHYIKGDKKNWDAFHTECVNDKPYQDVIDILLRLERMDCGCYDPRTCGCEWQYNDIYILSGRNEIVRDETERWLEQHVALRGIYVTGFNYNSNLVMRKPNDFRPDTEVKRDMVRELGLTPDNTLCVFDDRQCVVDMWREMGFRCLQVNAWEETKQHNKCLKCEVPIVYGGSWGYCTPCFNEKADAYIINKLQEETK